tara:strand:+ start:162 stop:656 length:495 start_codon:yes stop_codon:yes gene_type:complete
LVSVEKKESSDYLISLSPNSSLIGIYRIIFLASITLVCGGIATIFYFVGASLILPFAGLELTILFIAFYLSFRWSSKKEKIYISQEIVRIEKGIKKAEYSWEEFRTFTSFQVKRSKDKSLRLSFRSKGQDVYVGDFLNEDDKNLLRNTISEIIEDLNSLSKFSN